MKFIFLLILTILIPINVKSMADYKHPVNKILKYEGGFSRDPRDKGNGCNGCTNKGVIITTYRQFFGSHLTCEDLKNISDKEWLAIYKTYWDKIKGDEIKTQAIADLLVDFIWMSGLNAVKITQEVLNVKQDKIFGPVTLSALNNYPNQEELFNKLWNRRKLYYDRLIKNNPSQKCFYTGWMRRLNDYKWFD